MMIMQKASLTDYESVLSFYDDVTERTPVIKRYARWQNGKHPTTGRRTISISKMWMTGST